MLFLRRLFFSKSLILVLFFIFGVGYIFIFDSFDREVYEDQFNSAEIRGELILCNSSRIGTQFKVDNDSISYLFFPGIPYLKKYTFKDFSEVSDTIIKESFDDTIYVKKRTGERIGFPILKISSSPR